MSRITMAAALRYDSAVTADRKGGTEGGVLKATDLMKTTWPVVGPMAYERFLARGRGGMLIPTGAIKLRAGGEGIIDLDGRYVTEHDVTSGKVNIPLQAVEEFAAYDPEREVVFLFDDGTGITTYRGAASDQPTPKELHEKAKH